MKIDIAALKRSGASAEVEIPHTGKGLSSCRGHLVMYLFEVLIPAHERLVVMSSQALNIKHLEASLRLIGVKDDLTK